MEILLENYCNIVHIEGLTAIDIARKEIVPAVIDYQAFLLSEIKLKKEHGNLKSGLETNLLNGLSELSEKFSIALDKLVEDVEKYNSNWANLKKAKYCQNKLLVDMTELRKYADKMELLIGKDFSAFPTYEEILYSVKY